MIDSLRAQRGLRFDKKRPNSGLIRAMGGDGSNLDTAWGWENAGHRGVQKVLRLPLIR